MGGEQIKHNLCFALMPFSKEFKNQWDVAIEPAIIDAGLKPWIGYEEKLGTNIIIKDITESINKAVIIIADITGLNPNVMYELGLSHAAKKNVIILIQKEKKEEVPFDVGHIRFLEYDPLELRALKNNLCARIKSTLGMPEKDKPDLFPQLKIMSEEKQTELNYLKSKTISIEVQVYPPTADIFFNNKFIGNNKVTISVNKHAPSNTISFSVSGFYDVYIDIEKKHLYSGKIERILDPIKNDEDIYKRVPQWLRYRRKDPNNPVMMKAISLYLFDMGEQDEALAEAKELLELAPGWYMANNLVGSIISVMGNLDESEAYFKKVIALKPDHYVGYYNLACNASLRGKYQECIDYIEQITINEKCLESYGYTPTDIFALDENFDPIKENKDYSGEFSRLIKKINKFKECFCKKEEA